MNEVMQEIEDILNKNIMFSTIKMAPQEVFIHMNTLEPIKSMKKISNLILYKITSPLTGEKIYLDSNISNLPIGNVYWLYSLQIFVGYIIELPKYTIHIENNYVSLVRRNKNIKIYKNIKINLQTAHISVFSCSDDAIAVCANNRRYIDIRGGKH